MPPPRADARGDALPVGAVARLGSARLRHPPAARAVAFQGARTLVSAGSGIASFAVQGGRPGKRVGRVDRELWRLVISGDGKRAAAGQITGTVTIIDLSTGLESGSQYSPGGALVGLAYPARGGAALAAWRDGAVRWISPKGASSRDRFWLEAPVRAVALAPDGKTIAASHGAGRLEIRDARTGAVIRAFEGPPPEVRALALDGTHLACLTAEGVALLSPTTGEVKKSIELDEEGHGPHQIAFAPDGSWVAVAARPGIVKLFDVKTGAERATLAAASPGLTRRRPTFAIQPGGGLIATAGLGVTVRLWDTKSGKEVTPMPGHRDRVESLAFAPGAALLATAGPDGTVRLWETVTADERQVLTAKASGLGFLADGQLIAWGEQKDVLQVTDVASGTKLAEIKPLPAAATPSPDEDDPPPFALKPPASLTAPPPAPAPPPTYLGANVPLVRGVATHLDLLWSDAFALPAAARQAGATVTAALRGDKAALESLGVRPKRAPRPARTGPMAVLAAETGMLALADGKLVRLHDARTGVLARKVTFKSEVTALALSSDGSALAAGLADGSLSVHDVASGERRALVPASDDPTDRGVRAVNFSTDGKTYAWITGFGTVGVGKRASSERQRFPGNQLVRAHDVTLSGDGRWLATAGGDGVHVFELVTRQEVAHLLGHAGDVLRAAFSSDSRSLATASADGTVMIWDALAFEQLIR